MSALLKSLHLIILIHISTNLLALFAQNETQFIYNGFNESNLQLEGMAEIHPNGLLQLTNFTKQQTGHAFYHLPLNFNRSSSMSPSSLSFSTNFVFAMVPETTGVSGHGIVLVISPSTNFSQAIANSYLGLFNYSNNGNPSNHVFGIELDTVRSPDLDDINDNHVGIDVNSLRSTVEAPVTYFSNSQGGNMSLSLLSGNTIHIWIDYDDIEKSLNVTLAPTTIPRPTQPLISTSINLSTIFLDTMYVGFSSATGSVASNHYILGWSFNNSGNQAQSLDILNLPSLPPRRRSRNRPSLAVIVSVTTVSIIIVVSIAGAAYMIRRKKFEELREEWEREYGPQRFSYKDLYKATNGFKDLLGAGGFGKVYRGVLPTSKEQVAVKKVSHDSTQGIKEFVAEIASMGRLRHRNLVQLLGYCRRKGELLLVYDYMINGSLDKFLFTNEKSNLNWPQRYKIIRGITSSLLYLHEEWEQVVLHRDVKASNVLLDAELNGRLGDFGLARLYDHGTNPQTTHVVGTIGYLAPELTRTGKATTATDVFSYGAFMLEVVCGRRPIDLRGLPDEMILVDWVFEKWKEGMIIETVDGKLGCDYVVDEVELVLKLGLLCSHRNPMVRPSMRQVMQYLDGNAILPEMLIDNSGGGGGVVLMVGDGNQVSPDIIMSIGMDSIRSISSSESLLTMGR